ncbi:Ribulose bisphosphate carboxylase/oxygenase activase, chloroplastic [Vitis vinifera]|uniref:Ribulose bisphosphate carboxylase/oxygenase activase, chloroplastic n=1 Tax=Vitis vinifera TaxID=29760 RepID=A0A438JX44_VITVI|nr:Ribulose bisphosphate carboxylase/oxygenase activase, chloroplastic [Vitis vinifera]
MLRNHEPSSRELVNLGGKGLSYCPFLGAQGTRGSGDAIHGCVGYLSRVLVVGLCYDWCYSHLCFAACHIVKNYIAHLLNTKVPLILGIWGGKGQGKSFQTELIFQAMGIEPVIMSAGELESERAGTVDSLLIPFPLFLLGLFASMLLVL